MKATIEVRKKGLCYREPGALVETIQRKLTAECIGNFNPVFCTYKGKKTLVQSMEGDISDPFRRDKSYLKSLYIEVD